MYADAKNLHETTYSHDVYGDVTTDYTVGAKNAAEKPNLSLYKFNA